MHMGIEEITGRIERFGALKAIYGNAGKWLHEASIYGGSQACCGILKGTYDGKRA